jgi:hypothetical protein
MRGRHPFIHLQPGFKYFASSGETRITGILLATHSKIELSDNCVHTRIDYEPGSHRTLNNRLHRNDLNPSCLTATSELWVQDIQSSTCTTSGIK